MLLNVAVAFLLEKMFTAAAQVDEDDDEVCFDEDFEGSLRS